MRRRGVQARLAAAIAGRRQARLAAAIAGVCAARSAGGNSGFLRENEAAGMAYAQGCAAWGTAACAAWRVGSRLHRLVCALGCLGARGGRVLAWNGG